MLFLRKYLSVLIEGAFVFPQFSRILVFQPCIIFHEYTIGQFLITIRTSALGSVIKFLLFSKCHNHAVPYAVSESNFYP